MEKVDKIIKNIRGTRIAVSWPSNEDLPLGVLEGRPEHKRPVSNDSKAENTKAETKSKSIVADQEKPVKKPVKRKPRKVINK